MAKGVRAAAAMASRRPPRRVDDERDIGPLLGQGKGTAGDGVTGKSLRSNGTDSVILVAVRRL
jgi:hypothetical protein